jgi:periplasmic divalent cation tolerance protein
MSEMIEVITTTENNDNAREIARALVQQRLAACVQVSGPIESTYWWKGKVEQSQEWVCTVKTLRDLFGQVEQAIRQAHPYDVPQIIALPVVEASSAYVQWASQEVKSP